MGVAAVLRSCGGGRRRAEASKKSTPARALSASLNGRSTSSRQPRLHALAHVLRRSVRDLTWRHEVASRWPSHEVCSLAKAKSASAATSRMLIHFSFYRLTHEEVSRAPARSAA